jgi:hypothetical protein
VVAAGGRAAREAHLRRREGGGEGGSGRRLRAAAADAAAAADDDDDNHDDDDYDDDDYGLQVMMDAFVLQLQALVKAAEARVSGAKNEYLNRLPVDVLQVVVVVFDVLHLTCDV